MATTVTKPQPVDRLETQIVDWRKRLKELMSDLERAATRQKQSTEKRDALVLDAVAGNNAQSVCKALPQGFDSCALPSR